MKDIILLVILFLIFIFVFSSKGKNIVYQPLQPQTIFDVESSTIPVKQEKVISFDLSQQTLPTFKIYTELYVPEKFFVNVVKTKSAADYILVNEQLLQQKVIFHTTSQPTTQQTTLVKTKKVQTQQKIKQTYKTEKEQKTISAAGQTSQQKTSFVLNYQNIQNYVKQNPKTYFYPNLQTGKDVVLSCVSFTPYENKQGILKFAIENKQKSFFFINSISIETQDGQKLSAQVFSEQFVPPKENITGYIIFTVEPKKTYTLVICSNHTLKIQFSTPGGI